jgi:hypothetical protein
MSAQLGKFPGAAASGVAPLLTLLQQRRSEDSPRSSSRLFTVGRSVEGQLNAHSWHCPWMWIYLLLHLSFVVIKRDVVIVNTKESIMQGLQRSQRSC